MYCLYYCFLYLGLLPNSQRVIPLPLHLVPGPTTMVQRLQTLHPHPPLPLPAPLQSPTSEQQRKNRQKQSQVLHGERQHSELSHQQQQHKHRQQQYENYNAEYSEDEAALLFSPDISSSATSSSSRSHHSALSVDLLSTLLSTYVHIRPQSPTAVASILPELAHDTHNKNNNATTNNNTNNNSNNVNVPASTSVSSQPAIQVKDLVAR